MKSKTQQKKTNLENEYNKYFSVPVSFSLQINESLEQPSPLKIVPSISTSGAYEEPIKLEKVNVQHA
jgi:hypothetical protein